MEIPKTKIIDALRQRGEEKKAAQASQELPDTVDTDQHRDLLGRLGIDRNEVLGPLGDKLG